MMAAGLGAALFIGSVSPAFAANRLRTRLRLHDGSVAGQLLQDRTRDRDRLRDGSCLT